MINEALLRSIIDLENAEKIVSGSNHNYKVTPKGNAAPVFVTLFDKDNLGRIDKNVAVNSILTYYGIPTPSIIEYGKIENKTSNFGYLIRDYVEGRELHQDLSTAKNDGPKFNYLISKFAKSLADLHSIKFDSFGNIVCTVNGSVVHIEPRYMAWTDYLDTQVTGISNKINNLDGTIKIGDIHTSDLTKLGQDFGKLYSNFRTQISENVLPRFIHNDLLLSNVLMAEDTPIFIDYEWSISGDRAVDLAQLENWIEFTSYGSTFTTQSESFIRNYSANSEFPQVYPTKRKFYYFQRSLSYLLAAFSGSFTPDYLNNPKLEANVKTHFNLIDKIANGRGNIGVLNI